MKKLISSILVVSFFLSSTVGYAEAVDDKFTQITPSHSPGTGEYVHGQGYGKILMRVMLLGAVPTQGVHYVPEGTDLLFAIIYAGGYGEQTKLNGITIRRRGMRELVEVNLEDLIEDGKPIPKLADGDVVQIPFNWRKDIATISLVTGFITAMTGFTLSIIALVRPAN